MLDHPDTWWYVVCLPRNREENDDEAFKKAEHEQIYYWGLASVLETSLFYSDDAFGITKGWFLHDRSACTTTACTRAGGAKKGEKCKMPAAGMQRANLHQSTMSTVTRLPSRWETALMMVRQLVAA